MNNNAHTSVMIAVTYNHSIMVACLQISKLVAIDDQSDFLGGLLITSTHIARGSIRRLKICKLFLEFSDALGPAFCSNSDSESMDTVIMTGGRLVESLNSQFSGPRSNRIIINLMRLYCSMRAQEMWCQSRIVLYVLLTNKYNPC